MVSLHLPSRSSRFPLLLPFLALLFFWPPVNHQCLAFIKPATLRPAGSGSPLSPRPPQVRVYFEPKGTWLTTPKVTPPGPAQKKNTTSTAKTTTKKEQHVDEEPFETIISTAKRYISMATDAVQGVQVESEEERREADNAEWREAVVHHATKAVDFGVEGNLLAIAPVLLTVLILLGGRLPYLNDAAELIGGPGLIVSGLLFFITGG